ncbi:MAG TPA: hypothetical protein VNP72_05040 [Longimicrobium sp.]|nr:hypothetical protein [Longimicrobium sp.]
MSTPLPAHLHARLASVPPLLVSALGAWLIWYSSAWGVGVSPDSAEYIAAARRLGASGDVFGLPAQWAPGYPVLLSLVYSLPGDDVQGLTRLLQCALLAANLYTGIALLRHVLGRDSLLPAIGGAVLLLASNLWQVTFFAWSEGPFLLCLQGSALALLHHIERGDRASFLAAVVLSSLTLLFRYAGIACIGAAALALLLLRPGAWTLRLRRAAIFGVAAVSPFLVWIIASQLVRQETTNREFVVHLVSGADVLALMRQFASWLGWRRGVWLFVVEAVLVIMLMRQLLHGALPPRLRRLLVLAGVNVVVYTAFILFSKSFLDSYIPFDDRIFAPAWIFAVLALLASALHLVRQGPTRWLAALTLAIVAAGHAAGLAPAVAAAHDRGMGYLGATMSAVFDVREVPALASVVVYSNVPEYLRMRTEFTLRGYPRKFDPTTRLANPAYDGEVAAMNRQVRAGTALLVHYQGFEWRRYFPSLQDLHRWGYCSAVRGKGVMVLKLPAEGAARAGHDCG